MTRTHGDRELLGWLVGVIVRVWLWTLRVRVHADPALGAVSDRRWVLVFWHGTQLPLLAWHRRGPTVVLVSLSRDGALQSRALAMQGLKVVRGSSSRGGARGLVALVRAMRAQRADAAFAVDGPRGPAGVAKDGALVAARASGAVLVPMGSAARHGTILRGTWDRFAIAWPFAQVSVVLGPPLAPVEGVRPELEASLRRVNEMARESLEQSGDALAVSPR